MLLCYFFKMNFFINNTVFLFLWSHLTPQGVGKTTLLRHIAEGEIDLPRDLQIWHVEQEVGGGVILE